MKNLKNTQKWLHEVVTHPNGIHNGAFNTLIEGKKWNVDSVISPSKTLTSEERIHIYHNSYFARLIECFKSEYKGLLNALGDEMFEHFTWCFLQEHPSTSYTLNDLGKRFPEYLEKTLTESIKIEEADDWQLFIIDMAKYERIYTEVFNGCGHENIHSNDLFEIEPPKLSPSVALLKLKFPIASCIGKFRENEFDSIPKIQVTNYVLSRQRFHVNVNILENIEYKTLQDWMLNPSEQCPSRYLNEWRLKGIVYS